MHGATIKIIDIGMI